MLTALPKNLLRPLAITAAAIASVAAAAVAIEKAGKLMFPASGFSINALDEEPPKTPSTVLHMFLPVTDQFAPNVNVRIEPYPGTMAQYAGLSKEQIKDLGLTLIAQKETPNSLHLEYQGAFPNNPQELHFYATGFLGKGTIHLATGVALESQWKTVGPKLQACVDSLKPEPK